MEYIAKWSLAIYVVAFILLAEYFNSAHIAGCGFAIFAVAFVLLAHRFKWEMYVD